MKPQISRNVGNAENVEETSSLSPFGFSNFSGGTHMSHCLFFGASVQVCPSLTSPASARGLLLPKEELPQVAMTRQGPVAVPWQRDVAVGNLPWNGKREFEPAKVLIFHGSNQQMQHVCAFMLNG